MFCLNRYFLGIPEKQPNFQHLFRISSIPPKYGVAYLNNPQCLTCFKYTNAKIITTTNTPPRLATLWDDDWETESTLPPIPTSPTKKKKSKGKLHKRRI